MKNSPHDSESGATRKSAGNDQFRAVVKRLLDTPPMHKSRAVERTKANPKQTEPEKSTRTKGQ
jgi:hypothetical protein